MGFIFKPELIVKVRDETKTQTRRPSRPEDDGLVERSGGGPQISAVYRNRRKLWAVGQSYAVVPGRGKPALWRYTFNGDLVTYDGQAFTSQGVANFQYNEAGVDRAWLIRKGFRQDRLIVKTIRHEDARNISHADSLAEGFQNQLEFMEVWTAFYDPLFAFRRRKDLEEVDGPNYSGPTYELLQSGHLMDDLVLWNRYLRLRPANLYACWAITFCLEK